MLQYLWTYLNLLAQEEEGQDLAEYAILLFFIALVVIAAVTLLGPTISNVYISINDELAT
jgi:Flp pilus assembly pilin Flp